MCKQRIVTKLFATETRVLDFPKLKGYIKDLIGDAGFDATAKDLFELVFPNTSPKLYEKMLIVVTGDSPVEYISVTKMGNVYKLSMSKHNCVQYRSVTAKSLITMVENYSPTQANIDLESMKGKNLTALFNAIEKAEKAKGKNANVKGVLAHLQPNIKLGVGRFVQRTPRYEVTFLGMFGNVIAEVVDCDGFKRTTTNARDLRYILQEKSC